MKMNVLGTGFALATKNYNTCFALEENGSLFLVDGGGGNQILRQLEQSFLDWRDVHNIFVTHQHVDHFMGIIWMMRRIGYGMELNDYEGEVRIYSSRTVIDKIDKVAHLLLRPQELCHIGSRIHLIPVEDSETAQVLGHPITFFDIGNPKTIQFGFSLEYEPGKRLTCLGDEFCRPEGEKYVAGSEWLLHEAFCLESDNDIFHPHKIAHSTVKDACELAERYSVPNLILYHTEESHGEQRQKLYLEEGRKYFSGNLLVPDDLDVISVYR